ncbi:DUF4190 domain-containing protein [Agromyces sp. MMS24-JH15]|uniref:DUF4190 domain-containing protein n=1 Tax=Agromyces sp. MMS24-JH15 TaxID=3243765 RepID=UPI00374A1746
MTAAPEDPTRTISPVAPPEAVVPAYAAPAYASPAYGAPQPYSAPQPYGGQPYPGYRYDAQWSAPAAPPNNVFAWVAFGLGLGGLMFGLLTSIAAIVFGHLARRQIRERGEQGGAAALTGLIFGYVVTIGLLLVIVAYVLLIVFAIAASTSVSGVGSSL